MRLRNYKETIPYTIEDTLLDVHPHSLERPFHWPASIGERVWVLAGDEKEDYVRWRQGTVCSEKNKVYCDRGIFRTFSVRYFVKRRELVADFVPGLQMEMKPDSPEVRELLRQDGVAL
ncbi:hypothetical protein B0H34DRAFT_793110 [Crassisporium funariophilum]|nr:hypothetical protein B0H34DRAFT_793110 [Crassisporium funariophilum]